jgi:ATP-GRASP peptide maturase of grasp-with-spasm system
MIFILTDEEEPTTDLVIDWLLYYKKPFIRVSKDNIITIHKIYFSRQGIECVFSIQQFEKIKTIDTKYITSYWYRRSNLQVTMPYIKNDDTEIANLLIAHNHTEYKECYKILNYILNKKARINTIEDTDNIIKLKVLDCAKKNGLKVPDTLVCADKQTLTEFYNKHNGQIVTKSIGDPLSLFFEGFRAYTSRVEIKKIPGIFALSLFQEMIDKEFEIRTFYLNGQFYSSAIFSQMDEQTKLDFKNYNSTKPNRVVPFLLEENICCKLENLMHDLHFNSGSIDMILNPKHEYVFLEINPVGQFEQVSFPCNYNLFNLHYS